MARIAISTESVSDVSEKVQKELKVHVIHYNIKTEYGVFLDAVEISAKNVHEYIANEEHMILSDAPSEESYVKFFEELLESYDEVLHICVSKHISAAYDRAEAALARMDDSKRKKIRLIDSKQISGGVYLLIEHAVNMRKEKKGIESIALAINELCDKVHTSFITKNADYLYYNKRVKKSIMNICRALGMHPELVVKDGVMTLGGLYFGNYDRARLRYAKRKMRHFSKRDPRAAYEIGSGIEYDKREELRKIVEQPNYFDRIVAGEASAAVSTNCGPGTYGIIFRDK